MAATELTRVGHAAMIAVRAANTAAEAIRQRAVNTAHAAAAVEVFSPAPVTAARAASASGR